MANVGIAPIEEASPVGVLRSLIGDTHSVPLEPPVAGRASFDYFSDAELAAFIATSARNSVTRAAGMAVRQMATVAAMEAASIAQVDLRVDTTARATGLFKAADSWFAQADAEDRAADLAANTHFEVVFPRQRTYERGGW